MPWLIVLTWWKLWRITNPRNLLVHILTHQFQLLVHRLFLHLWETRCLNDELRQYRDFAARAGKLL